MKRKLWLLAFSALVLPQPLLAQENTDRPRVEVKIGNGPKAVEAKRVAAGKKLGVKKDVAVINLVVKAIEAEASVVLVKANAVADRADHPRDDPAGRPRIRRWTWPGDMGPGGFGPGAFMRIMPVLAALDADSDGELSASEIENASKALMRLDKNGDGKLSMEEMRPDPNAMPNLMGRLGGGEGPAPVALKVARLSSLACSKDGMRIRMAN